VPDVTGVVVHLRVAGVLMLALAAAHLVLPRALGWPVELQGVSLLTRQVSYVHTYFIGLMCGLFGLAATVLATDLVRVDPAGAASASDRPAAAILVAATAVWGSRLVAQLVVFDPELWRGSALTVLGHVAFVALWAYLTVVFAWALARHL
jgi:hypothetical protein